MTLIAVAILARRRECPICGVRSGVACNDKVAGRQRLTLSETHLERLALVSERYQGEDPRVDAEG